MPEPANDVEHEGEKYADENTGSQRNVYTYISFLKRKISRQFAQEWDPLRIVNNKPCSDEDQTQDDQDFANAHGRKNK